MDLKPIKKAHKPKRRYLAFEIISEKKIIDFSEVLAGILANLNSFMGKDELTKAHMRLLKETWNPQNQKGLIKVNNSHIKTLREAVSCVKSLGKINARIKTLGVSGMIKKAKARYLA